MKCIISTISNKNIEEGIIDRVSDYNADMKVKSGFWNYTSKSEWKNYKQKPIQKSDDGKPKKDKLVNSEKSKRYTPKKIK